MQKHTITEIYFIKKGLNAKTFPGVWVSCKNTPRVLILSYNALRFSCPSN